MGHACLKAVALEKNADTGEVSVLRYATYRLENKEQPLGVAVGKLLRRLRSRTKQCAVAFWPPHSVLRFVERSSSDNSSLRQWLQSPQSPLGDLQDHLLDFCDLGPSPDDPTQRRFVVCASPRESVRDIARELEKAGLHPVLMQLTPMALSNAFHFSRDKQSLPFLTCDIGAHGAHISGGHSDQVLLLRTVPWGAEQFLQSMGAHAVTLEDGRFAVSGQTSLTQALSAAVEPLAMELRQSADFIQNSADTGRLESIHLSGYLSTLPEFIEALDRELLIPCTLWNPFQKITASDKALAGYKLLSEISRLPAAAGAALQYLT